MPRLFIVATPIGNLSDISARALQTLRDCDLIAAEDTRVTRALLNHFEINTPCVSNHQHNEENRAAPIVARMLEEDLDVALVTDAGTPCISDPGSFLAKEAAAAGIEVLAEQSGQNTTDGAMATMEDLLNRFPGEINAVLCHNDDTAIGAMNACKSAGVDDMIIVGFDGNASAVDLILAGEMVKATVAQQPYEMGYQAVEAALKAIKDETVEEVINAPVTVVTAENGQEYLDSLAAMQG